MKNMMTVCDHYLRRMMTVCAVFCAVFQGRVPPCSAVFAVFHKYDDRLRRVPRRREYSECIADELNMRHDQNHFSEFDYQKAMFATLIYIITTNAVGLNCIGLTTIEISLGCVWQV